MIAARFVEVLRFRTDQLVVADDLDKFSKGLREEVIKLVAASGHVLLASMTELSSRTRGLLLAQCADAIVVSLEDPASRPEDVRAFIARWLPLNGLTADGNAVQDCTAFCCASGLPQGFRTVEDFLVELASSGWGFSRTAPGSRRRLSVPAGDCAAANTADYLCGRATPTGSIWSGFCRAFRQCLRSEVRDCGGASKVAERVIALRNQGSLCVAVLDSDNIGKRLRKQLLEFGHPVVGVPVDAVNLPGSAYDHVQRVAEIEDLLPVSVLERFLSSGQRRPGARDPGSHRRALCDRGVRQARPSAVGCGGSGATSGPATRCVS